MRSRPLFAAVGLLSWAIPATAQEAVETLQTMPGGGASSGRGAGGYGGALSQAFDRAARRLQAPTAPSASSAPPAAAASRKAHASAGHITLLRAAVDPLAGTSAPTYRLSNGASIRVSGDGFTPAAGARCVRNCGSAATPVPAPGR